jgi:tryptophan 2,3-dioxygenase
VGHGEVRAKTSRGHDDTASSSQCRASARMQRALSLSMQPVYIVHDEYLFIRILQSFEVTFAAMASEIRDAIGAVRSGDADSAAASIISCGRTLAAARSLFTVLATMRVEAFRAFRVYTVGASAIQSGNYKIFEALCSAPPGTRIESPAYESVPYVRDHVLGQWTDLLSTVEHAVSLGLIDSAGLSQVRAAAWELEKVHQMWKRTHWKMADRMIGEERGTGYTVGVPYLKEVLDNRLFRRILGSLHLLTG